jgi:D-aspartate ligase
MTAGVSGRSRSGDGGSPRALVLGNGVAAYGAIRSLGRAGVPVSCLHYVDTGFAHTSRYVSETVRVPHPVDEERRFIEFLLDRASDWKGSLLLESNDRLAVTLSRHREELAPHYAVATPGWNRLHRFIEKSETYALAESVGVPCPTTFTPTGPEELRAVRDRITYPCFLKPKVGHEFKTRFGSKGSLAHDYAEVSEKLARYWKAGLTVMIQEIIPGPDSELYSYVTYVDSTGSVAGEIYRRKRRQNPPSFGVARVISSHDPIPVLGEYTRAMLQAADYRGFACAEFKLDRRDGRYKLIEINIRMLRTTWLATHAGVNFPALIYRDLVRNERGSPAPYRTDAYWIDLYPDLLNSLARNRQEDLRLRDYFRPYLAPDRTFAVLSREDPRPFLTQVAGLPRKYAALLRWRRGARRKVESAGDRPEGSSA